MIHQLALFLPLLSSPTHEAADTAAQDAKTPKIAYVAVRAPTDSSKNGNAILEIAFDTTPNFRALSLSKEGKRLAAKDDGVYPDQKAGDGVFAVLTTLKEAPKGTTRGSFWNGEGAVSLVKLKVKFIVVDCPPNCTTPLGGACWFCIEVGEVEVEW